MLMGKMSCINIMKNIIHMLKYRKQYVIFINSI